MITTIDKLFKIVYGQKEYHNKERLEGTEGNNILISSSGVNNGLYGFFDIKPGFQAPVISVQGYGTIGHAFVQEYDCSIDDHMLILIPKIKITLEELFQVAFQIRLTKWKYRYGRGITPDRLKYEKIKILKSRIRYKQFAANILPKATRRVSVKRKKVKLVPITDLCDINREYYYYVEEVDKTKEVVPYITTSEYDNGVGAFCNEEPIFKKRSLTVSLDGKCGLSFYQITDFISGEKTAVLTAKDNIDNATLIYIGMIIRSISWRYNYCRKLSMERLVKMEIPMPINEKGNFDFEYIEKLIKNCYGYDEIKKYL